MELVVSPLLNGRLSVRRTSNILLALFGVEANLSRSMSSWVARTAPTHLKLGMVEHIYEDTRHADSLRRRIQQLRTPDDWITVPLEPWRQIFDRIDEAPSPWHAIAAGYGVVKRALCEQYRHLLSKLDETCDAPTQTRVLAALSEEEAQIEWGMRVLESSTSGKEALSSTWLRDYREYVLRIGLVDEQDRIPPRVSQALSQHHTGFWRKTFAPLPRSVKDPRYATVHKGFTLHRSIARTDDLSTPGGVANRLHRMLPFEYSTAEACTRNIFEHEDMPWAFYMDMARIAWDERRHAIAVIHRLNELGSDVGDFPLPPWTAYEIVMDAPLAGRLLKLHRILEGDALDLYVQRVADLRETDPETARLYDFIEADEIGHTLLGQRWYFYLVGGDRERIARETTAAWQDVAPKWICAHEMLSAWARDEDPGLIQPREHSGPSYFDLDRKVKIATVGRRCAGFTPEEVERLVRASSAGSVEF